MDPMAQLDLLTSPAGVALLARLADLEPTADTELALAAAPRREHLAELVTAALAQYEPRRRARAEPTGSDRMWLTRDGLEQASAEPVARRRAARYAGAGRVADLCRGIGGDLVALAERCTEVLAVDPSRAPRCRSARRARSCSTRARR